MNSLTDPYPTWVEGNHISLGVKTYVEILPDPHLGRLFKADVPLHRRGDREEMVWQDFERRLRGESPEHYLRVQHRQVEAKIHVTLGDLFDKPVMPADVVIRAADAYFAASQARPDTTFIIYPGNHDISRDLGSSAYDLFRRIVQGENSHDRIVVLRDHSVPMSFPAPDGGPTYRLGFVPWSPVKTAAEMVSSLPDNTYDIIFGHWDMTGDTPNLIPVNELVSRTNGAGVVITGHDHKRRMENRRGVRSGSLAPGVHTNLEILCAGSMQPYAHGEDDGAMYRTCTLDTIPEDARDLCLRILLKPGETIPEGLDALAIQPRRVTADEVEALPELQDYTFNVSSLLSEALSRKGVMGDVRERILSEFGSRGGG